MRVADFDFHLPEDRIALRPVSPRDSARLLTVGADGRLVDRQVRDLPAVLEPGDCLVFNDTRVIPARLFGVRDRFGHETPVQATLLKRVDERRWTALMRPGRRLRPGDAVRFEGKTLGTEPLRAQVEEKGADGSVRLAFSLEGRALDAAIRHVGAMPLPPYIAAQRAEDDQDLEDYQTVFNRVEGSVAAPTAGLHFTPALLEALKRRDVDHVFVTLHVGAGTFLPVKSETVEAHRMHAETGSLSAPVAERLNAVRAAGGRLVCIGTTALRLLETAATEDGRIAPFQGETAIFITPGYRFRAADVLLTNFHLPRSTLLMLVAAFAGAATTRAAYDHAVQSGYRFYSYGDAGLWFRQAGT